MENLVAVLVAGIAIIPATISAIYSRRANDNSKDALHEVRTNGGVHKDNPTLKDYTKHIDRNVGDVGRRLGEFETTVAELERTLSEHLKESDVIRTALAEIYLIVKEASRSGKL